MRAIFTIDPGVHTGVAYGIVDERHPVSAAQAVKDRLYTGSTTVTGEPLDQARELFNLWTGFKQLAVKQGHLDPGHVELVIEDFVLRGGQHAGGRDGTAPERIAYAFLGYRQGRHDTFRTEKHISPVIWQQPGQAAVFKTKPRLESAGAWVRGRDHEQSAFSHMLLRVNTLMANRSHRPL